MSESEKAQDTIVDQPEPQRKSRKWREFFGAKSSMDDPRGREERDSDAGLPSKWSMGILNDTRTHEVPGSVLLLTGHRNAPLGLQNAPSRTTHSSLPQPPPQEAPPVESHSRNDSGQTLASNGKKMTKDGSIILEPQPHDSSNDPLNWPTWRRDAALLSLGLFCLVGGGMTPVLAAGFTNIEAQFDVSSSQVALTTGLFMMGLGVGSVFASPTAILYGKRPVYLVGAVCFILSAVWCAVSKSFVSLLIARIFMGISVSPVECLPSATIAEIYFLHERAFRIGIYTLLLLSGKNLVPLVSAAIIQTLGWRWVFWIVAIVVGFCLALLFFFVPETFWDRTPHPKSRAVSAKSSKRTSFFSHRAKDSRRSSKLVEHQIPQGDGPTDEAGHRRNSTNSQASAVTGPSRTPHRAIHIGFSPEDVADEATEQGAAEAHKGDPEKVVVPSDNFSELPNVEAGRPTIPRSMSRRSKRDQLLSLDAARRVSFSPSRSFPLYPTPRYGQNDRFEPLHTAPPTPNLHNFNSPFYIGIDRSDSDYLNRGRRSGSLTRGEAAENTSPTDSGTSTELSEKTTRASATRYTAVLANSPRRTFTSELRPFNGRLHQDNWLRVAIRPFILFCYPAVLWSSIVYACSIGWLIVLSESVSTIYRSKDTYNFSALSAGLVYVSPFIGGILGTAVAGKVSDFIVRAMSRRNGGLYEPEFRLVMAIPVAVTTSIGLMGYGWAAQVHDNWIVPTVFFGVISFGCSLGSTTAITFCVDSYRQYAGEALVTLNFSKNIFHGLVFSLFFNSWLNSDGSRIVFISLGVIQLGLLAFTIPMYIFGKRARMWTVRKNLMEKF